jgi:SAM-dependent methyltransferase
VNPTPQTSVPRIPRKYARSETMTPGFDRTIALCLDRLGLARDSLLLDVPCGKGEAIIRLGSATGCRTVGVDRSPELARRAAAKVGAKNLAAPAQVILGDGGRTPFPDGTFDACVSIGGPSCIGGHTIRDALTEQVRVIKPGAFLVVTDMFRNVAHPNPWIGPDHPDVGGWWDLLWSVGLRVVFFEHFEVSAWDEYHAPMRELVAEARRERHDDSDEMRWADEVEREIEMDLPPGAWADYGTFLAQKAS